MTDEITGSIGPAGTALFKHVCEHADSSDNSVCEMIGRGLGLVEEKTITLSSGGGTVSTNIFQITKNLHIVRIYGEVIDVTDIDTCTDCHWDLWDGNASVAITKITGTTLTNVAVDSLMIKNEAVASSATIVNSSAGAVTEATDPKKAFSAFCVSAKNGANTYIRFTYTNDATINAQIKFFVEYVPLNGGTLVVV